MLPYFYRLHGWFPVFAQEGGFSVAKAVHDAVMQDGEKLGNANDSVRLGVLSVLFVAIVGLFVWACYKVIAGQYKRIEEQDKAAILDLRARLSKAEETLDREREGRREDQEARNAVMRYTIDQFNARYPEAKNDVKRIYECVTGVEDLLRRQANLGALPMRKLDESRPVVSSPQLSNEEPEMPGERPPSRPTQFLPAGPRRIRPRGETKEDK